MTTRARLHELRPWLNHGYDRPMVALYIRGRLCRAYVSHLVEIVAGVRAVPVRWLSD